MELRTFRRYRSTLIPTDAERRTVTNLIRLQTFERESGSLSFEDFLSRVNWAGAQITRAADGEIGLSTERRTVILPKSYGIIGDGEQISKDAALEILDALARP
jgi:hypothetical protein